ncbi:MAG: hypothetical protein H6713_12170 [Myxococcales bacterium]|nr:hypothetical protein [Myxococcales bacterium]
MAGSDISAYYSLRLTDVNVDGTTLLAAGTTWSEVTRTQPYRTAAIANIALGRIPLPAFTRPDGTSSIAPYGARVIVRARGLSDDAEIGVVPYPGDLPESTLGVGQQQPLGDTPTIGLWVLPNDLIWINDPDPAREARIDLFIAPQNNRETDSVLEFWSAQSAIIHAHTPPENDFTFIEVTGATVVGRETARTLIEANTAAPEAIIFPALGDTEPGDTIDVVNKGDFLITINLGASTVNGFAQAPNNYNLRPRSSVRFISTGSTWGATGALSTQIALVNGPTVIQPFRGRFLLGVTLAVAGDITLPDPTLLPEDAEIWVVRWGGIAAPNIVNPAGTINGQASITLTNSGAGRILRPSNNSYYSA